MLLFFTVFLKLCVVVDVHTRILEKGDTCQDDNGVKGSCIHFLDCTTARTEIATNWRPKICSFEGKWPIVCCKENKTSNSGASMLAAIKGETTTAKPNRYTPFDENSKSLKACRDLYPRPSSYGYIGGSNAPPRRYPFMALLGYGEPDSIQWQCGGSLISLEFVLTAAHCLYSQLYGEVRHIRLGELDLNSTTDDANPQDFTIREIHKHPDYTPLSTYHDIAVVHLDRPAVITDYVKPACLAVTRNLTDQWPEGMGWGITDTGRTASILQAGYLRFVSNQNCSKVYGVSRRYERGILDEIQICADGGGRRQDTCQGDSGGPLQISNFDYEFGYFPEIVAVTSFGKQCATAPGVYTRVLTYVPWIESIIW